MGLDMPAAQALTEYANSTITANGTEQTVVELTTLGTLEGWIDLANMQAGDTVVIKAYVKIQAGGTYRRYASNTYSGVQASPALHTVKLPANHGFKITLDQTAGTNRTFAYDFFKGNV